MWEVQCDCNDTPIVCQLVSESMTGSFALWRWNAPVMPQLESLFSWYLSWLSSYVCCSNPAVSNSPLSVGLCFLLPQSFLCDLWNLETGLQCWNNHQITKCDVNQMKGLRDMRKKDRRSDRGLFLYSCITYQKQVQLNLHSTSTHSPVFPRAFNCI